MKCVYNQHLEYTTPSSSLSGKTKLDEWGGEGVNFIIATKFIRPTSVVLIKKKEKQTDVVVVAVVVNVGEGGGIQNNNNLDDDDINNDNDGKMWRKCYRHQCVRIYKKK